SSLFVQLQSGFPISTTVCVEDSSSSIDFSYQRLFSFKCPQYVFVFMYFNN
ncbi:hypothetical protein M9458_055201, partial [Cirrhinus mrigala]